MRAPAMHWIFWCPQLVMRGVRLLPAIVSQSAALSNALVMGAGLRNFRGTRMEMGATPVRRKSRRLALPVLRITTYVISARSSLDDIGNRKGACVATFRVTFHVSLPNRQVLMFNGQLVLREPTAPRPSLRETHFCILPLPPLRTARERKHTPDV